MAGLNSAAKRTCVLEYLLRKICDCMEEGPVLLLFFPSLSLSPLFGLLKHGVCVCCFVLFILSGCCVVMCEKINKKMLITKKKKKKSGCFIAQQSTNCRTTPRQSKKKI